MTTYVLVPAAPVAVGLRRVVAEQLADASAGLRAASGPGAGGTGQAVHSARKSVKKVRAVLRLVRPHLKTKAYRRETAALRDAAHLLGSARDAEVLADLVDRLLGRPGAPAELNAVQLALRSRADAATRLVALGDGEVAARRLDACAARLDEVLASLPVGEDADDTALLDDGLRRLREQEERRRVRALERLDALGSTDDPADDDVQSEADEALHDWRKRVKDLWYAGRLLAERGADPDETSRLDVLADALGADHDAAVLLGLLRAARADRLPDDAAGTAALLAATTDDETRARLPGLLQAYRLPQRQLVRELLTADG